LRITALIKLGKIRKNMKNKTNIIIALLTTIVLILIVSFVSVIAPINIGRKYSNFSQTHTIDAVLVKVNWTVKYKAPLIIPKEIKEDIEKKIDIYVGMRLFALINRSKAIELFKLGTENGALQEAFDRKNVIDFLIELSPELSKQLSNIKYVRLNEITFEKAFKDYLDKKILEEQDTHKRSDINGTNITKL
jgi:hypothetical protein